MLTKRLESIASLPFASLVFNFVDMLTHGRNQSEILAQIAPDESAFRSVVRSWFVHSALLEILRERSFWSDPAAAHRPSRVEEGKRDSHGRLPSGMPTHLNTSSAGTERVAV